MLGSRMTQLDNIERDIGSQVDGMAAKTRAIEGELQSHAKDINSIEASLSEVAPSLQKQDSSLEKLSTYTEELASNVCQRFLEVTEVVQSNLDQIGGLGAFKD